MKRRFVSLFMVLILAVPLLLVCVSADGFSYEFQSVASEQFCSTGYVPPGDYNVFLYDRGVAYGPCTVSLNYELSEDDDRFYISLFEIVFSTSSGDVALPIVLVYGPFDVGYCTFLGAAVSDRCSFVFEPIAGASVGLSSFFTSDSFSGVLDDVLLLIPVVLGVTVSYIGIRKGIVCFWASSLFLSSMRCLMSSGMMTVNLISSRLGSDFAS